MESIKVKMGDLYRVAKMRVKNGHIGTCMFGIDGYVFYYPIRGVEMIDGSRAMSTASLRWYLHRIDVDFGRVLSRWFLKPMVLSNELILDT